MARPALTIRVHVRPLSEHTDADAGRWAFAYTLTIRNDGDIPAQIVARHWRITDERGQTNEVRGLGVVGQQPLLKPGETFEYSSWTPLTTPQGTMEGSLFAVTEDAQWFEAPVAEFMLVDSARLH